MIEILPVPLAEVNHGLFAAELPPIALNRGISWRAYQFEQDIVGNLNAGPALLRSRSEFKLSDDVSRKAEGHSAISIFPANHSEHRIFGKRRFAGSQTLVADLELVLLTIWDE